MEIITLSDKNFSATVKEAAKVLARGGIVMYPTDTLYGLAVAAHDTKALAKLKELKGREKKKPISVVVRPQDIEAYAELTASPRYYAKHFLPGALTLVVPGKNVPEELMLAGNIGIRVPDDAFALALAEFHEAPFTATSANRAGLPTFAAPREILQQFGQAMHGIDLVIDAGERAGGLGSTVMTFRDNEPYILREGALSRRELGL